MSESTPAKTQDQAERWEAPAIDGSDGLGFLTAQRLQELQKDAYDEAYQAGLKKGLKAGEDEVKRRALRLDELLKALAHPFEKLDETVEKQLVELSITIAKQLFRREIQIEPSHIMGVVREAVQLLPVASRNIAVHMHPEDAKLLRGSLSTPLTKAWAIVEDPLINRGGCKISSDTSNIDAQADTRFQTLVNSITGDERQQ